MAWGRAALNITVHLGDHDLNSNSETKTITRKVYKLKRHAKYNRLTTDYDVALIEMLSPIQFEKHIRPICIPSQGKKYTGKF